MNRKRAQRAAVALLLFGAGIMEAGRRVIRKVGEPALDRRYDGRSMIASRWIDPGMDNDARNK